MDNKIINGKNIANKIKDQIKTEIDQLVAQNLRIPKLTVVQVGDDPASTTYIKNKRLACQKIGINFELIKLDNEVSEQTLINTIHQLNNDTSVDGFLVQLPLPKHIDTNKIISAISVDKDVDGFSTHVLGNLLLNNTEILPATPKGIMLILKQEGIDVVGKHVVVIGRSNIVGKPIANLLINAHATVTICHSKTINLPRITKQADILIAAVGQPNFVTKKMIKRGAIIIDVGTTKVDGKLTGDVDLQNVYKKVGRITPVPGGVGPMTIAGLLDNLMTLYHYHEHQKNND